jgi:hypothetical protein
MFYNLIFELNRPVSPDTADEICFLRMPTVFPAGFYCFKHSVYTLAWFSISVNHSFQEGGDMVIIWKNPSSYYAHFSPSSLPRQNQSVCR